MAIDVQRRTDHIRRSGEFVTPEAIANYDAPRTRLFVTAAKGATDLRARAQDGKNVGCQRRPAHVQTRVARTRNDKVVRQKRAECREGLILLAQVHEVWIRKWQLLVRPDAFVVPNRHQAGGFRIRQRSQQNAAQDGEERSVCSDPKHERDECRRGEGFLPLQVTRSEADILQESFETAAAACIAIRVLDDAGVAELARRFRARFRRRPAARDKLLRTHAEVEPQFLVHLALEALLAEDTGEACAKDAPELHLMRSAARA